MVRPWAGLLWTAANLLAASGKFPWLVEANPSYHGLSFTRDVGAAAFVTYVRAVILRDLGATLSPFAALHAGKGSPSPEGA